MKKTRLIVDYQYEFDLLGIISSIKFYKLAWAINNKLNIRLVRESEYEVPYKDGSQALFSHYIYSWESGALELFKNKSESSVAGYLVPEMSHIDYILKIDINSQSFAKEEVIKALRDVKWIEYIAALDVDNLKSRDNFLS